MGRSGERGSGISVLPARYDDDDDFKQFCLAKVHSLIVKNISISSYSVLFETIEFSINIVFVKNSYISNNSDQGKYIFSVKNSSIPNNSV